MIPHSVCHYPELFLEKQVAAQQRNILQQDTATDWDSLPETVLPTPTL